MTRFKDPSRRLSRRLRGQTRPHWVPLTAEVLLHVLAAPLSQYQALAPTEDSSGL
jgi:hypothetical protein